VRVCVCASVRAFVCVCTPLGDDIQMSNHIFQKQQKRNTARTNVRTGRATHTQKSILATHAHALARTCFHTLTHKRARTHTQTRIHMHAHVHTNTHTHTHTCIHTHTHTTACKVHTKHAVFLSLSFHLPFPISLLLPLSFLLSLLLHIAYTIHRLFRSLAKITTFTIYESKVPNPVFTTGHCLFCI